MAEMEAAHTAYFEGKYIPTEDAKVSILTHAFNYGTGLFEGIRGYFNKDEDKIRIFRLAEHIDRFDRNCNILYMDLNESREELEQICIELVKRSEFREDVYIRPLAYKSELSLGPKLKGVESSFCCWVIKLGDYVEINAGLDVAVSSWRRLSDNAVPARAKTTLQQRRG